MPVTTRGADLASLLLGGGESALGGFDPAVIAALIGQPQLQSRTMPGRRQARSLEDIERELVTQILRENADKNFVQRILRPREFPTIDLGGGWRASHLMAAEVTDDGRNIVFPTVVYDDTSRELRQMPLRKAQAHAIKTGEFIEFPSLDTAIRFSSDYKKFWEVE